MSKRILAATFGLALTFFGCGGEGGGGGDNDSSSSSVVAGGSSSSVGVVNVYANSAGVESWNGNGIVIMEVFDSYIKIGEIASGKLSLDLPSEAEIPPSLIRELPSNILSVSPADLKYVQGDDFYVSSNDGKCYHLRYDRGTVVGLYWYFSKAATITGTPDATFNISAPKGWNEIYIVGSETSGLWTADRSVLEVTPIWYLSSERSCRDEWNF